MLKRIHQKLGTAGFAIAIVALVAALGGTALAASGALSGKQKKEVEKIAKKFAGKPGATGPAGAPGSNGTNGKDGALGAPGKDGVSVTASAASLAECESGGIKVTSASPPVKVCNGETGFTSTLPSGETETGTWSMYNEAAEAGKAVMVPISFNIPLEDGVSVHTENNLNFIGPEEGEGEPHQSPVIPDGCKGTAAKPEAVGGNLCVFAKFAINAKRGAPAVGGPTFFNPQEETGDVNTGTAGVLLGLKAENAGLAFIAGSWAVTAE